MKIHKIQLYGQGNCGPGYARWARLSVRNSHWLSHDMFQYGDTLKWLLKCWKIRVNLGSLKSIYLDFSDKAWQTYVFGLSWVDLLNLRLFSKFAQNSVWKESSPRCQPLSFVRLLASRTSIIVSAFKVQETLRIHKDSKGPQRYVVDTTLYCQCALPWVTGFGSLMTPWQCFTGWIDSMHHAKRGVTFVDTVVIWWFLWRLQDFNNHHWRNQVVQGTEGWFWMIFDVPFQASFDGEVRWLRKAPEASSGGCIGR